MKLALVALLLSLGLLSQTSPARAESPEPSAAASEKTEFNDSELGQAERSWHRARIGLGFSAAGLSIGAVLLGFGIAFNGDENGSGDVSSQVDAKGLIISGAILAAGGLAGLPVSALRVRRAKLRIDRLEHDAPQTTVLLSPTGVSLRYQF